MTNTAALKELIDRSGLKYYYVAASANLTYQGLKNKIENVHDFTTSEINALCSLLGITDLHDKEAIFFADKVE